MSADLANCATEAKGTTDETGALPPGVTANGIASLVRGVSAGSGSRTVVTRAPFTLRPLADLPLSTPDDVQEAFDSARRAQAGWAATPVAERAAILLRFHDLVLDHQDEVLDLMQAEAGKTRRDAFLEVADIAMTSRYYARKAASLLKPKRRQGVIPGLTHTTELRHPKGVVAVVSPWNYPLSMAASDTLAALMAGNAVVQKPDTQTALTALWARDLMVRAGVPADVWQIVINRGSVIGETMMQNADYMMFTGSTASGRRIARDAGERLIGASLELGGKNPMVVLADADLDKVVDGVIRGCFPSAGQLCVSAERLYVHESVHDELLVRIKSRTEALSLGTARDFRVDVGSLTNEAQLATVTSHVEDALAKGAVAVTGGRPRPDIGPLFYEPTVLTGVTPDMLCHKDETFGPVVSVYSFRTEEEAVQLANDTVYGLNASVWTRNGRRGREVAARIHAGTVNVNEAYVAAWGSVAAPMGGMGDSGVGRRHGAEGLLKYTEQQTVAHQRLHGLTPPRGVSQSAFAWALTASLRMMKRAGLA